MALNAALARHNAVATNIANANNENYRPLRLQFDEQLALFQNRLVDGRYDASNSRLLQSLGSSVALIEDPTAAKVQLDVETARMVQNAVHYQALLAAHGKLNAIIRMAISGGRQ